MSESLHDMNDELLVKYLLGETSPEESGMVKAWMAESELNRQCFEHFRLIWERSFGIAAHSKVDPDDAWKRFQLLTGQQPATAEVVVRSQPRRARLPFLRAAAAILLTAGAITLFYLNWRSGADAGAATPVTIAARNSSLTDTLPDGSIVTLNKRSSLRFPSDFKDGPRTVQLEGEAFFRITPDPARPFEVRINDVIIKVLGTSFNVKSNEGVTEVIVETGLVQVSHSSHQLQLRPKEKLSVSAADTELKKDSVSDQLYKYYRTREFVCDNTPLWKLVDVLNEAYDARIVIERPALRNLRIDVPFYDESLDNILDVITETFNDQHIQVVKQDSLIILK
ncbi:MAG: FecR domain-containing protein [Candidatus Pseudobacter hemicellulosilyticus]|uniref:FecR domain-containing protein n=1 Tax=Candidatus Pseudobacter hemicellulosilyticus TaxID=3121375 RepID=A0AAJ6BJI1_9BACT|nr:MAG: FecR domain-containing protein [Pseudobacter sp.]